MDGFDQNVNVKVRELFFLKTLWVFEWVFFLLILLMTSVSLLFQLQVIMATNRADTLDPALLRPGRLDRKIEFPLPDRRQKRLVFSTITSRMNLSEEVDLEDCILTPHIVFIIVTSLFCYFLEYL